MEKELTILDECAMEGAMIVLKRYVNHLQTHLTNAACNFESSNFNKASFIADVDYALDNADIIIQATEIIKEKLLAMREEVSSMFNTKKKDL